MVSSPKLFFSIATFLAIFFVVVGPVRAQEEQNSGLLINCEKTEAKRDNQGQPITDQNGEIQYRVYHNCTVDDFLNQFVILMQWGLRILAVLAVLMIVYSGWHFITAGGRSDKINEGKRVLSGTITGVILSLVAYIIINFTVTAITGSQVRSLNPFQGFIGQVFPNSNVNKPFSGPNVQTGPNPQRCRELWQGSACSDHVLCADPGSSNGPITTLQTDLKTLGCNCGTVDGCFGASTAACVRQFQAGQRLPLTGIYDHDTSERAVALTEEYKRWKEGNAPDKQAQMQRVIDQAGCQNADTARIISALPPTTTQSLDNAGTSGSGCCIVGNYRTEGGFNSLYCVSDMNQRNCIALGHDSLYLPNVRCDNSQSYPEVKQHCGFCTTCDEACQQANARTPYFPKCIMGSDGLGPQWCTGVANPALFYVGGEACVNNPKCAASCTKEARVAPP